MLALLIRQQVLKTQDAKPADPCQRQRWSLNNDGFICLKGTPLVLGLTESSNEVKDLDIFGFVYVQTNLLRSRFGLVCVGDCIHTRGLAGTSLYCLYEDCRWRQCMVFWPLIKIEFLLLLSHLT